MVFFFAGRVIAAEEAFFPERTYEFSLKPDLCLPISCKEEPFRLSRKKEKNDDQYACALFPISKGESLWDCRSR